MVDLQYPIGKFQAREDYSPEEIQSYIERIASLPSRLRSATANLNRQQLDTPYRDGGWTVRQVVHHVADSHMNAYIRLKWTLTEDSPLIKAYDEKAWAQTPETNESIELSLDLIEALHKKWCTLLKKVPQSELKKYFTHPQTQKQVTLQTQLAMYAWHSDHHLAHITNLKSRMGW